MAFLQKIFGSETSRTLKEFEPIVAKINAFEPSISVLTDSQFKEKTLEFQNRLKDGQTLDSILPEAFALVREAGKRTRNERHFDVQMFGGLALHFGNISEMRTGEGKTLVATLPAYLNALTGQGVHIVTVNDYLSRRDAVWMGQVYDFLGLSVGVINHDESFLYDPKHNELDKERDTVGSFHVVNQFLRPVSRQEAYMADIVYGTNSEFGFDYLRDNIEYDAKHLRQRNHNYAIVDEIDSILIDEARTPLIISAPSGDSEDLYRKFADIAEKLDPKEHYEVDEKLKAITLTDVGITRAEEILGIGNIYTEKGIKYVHHLETAIRAKALFQKDKDYVVKSASLAGGDGEVIIVDEFTGRLQPGRRWSEGLHQAIEAKENVQIQKESKTFASITYQNFFRMYKKLSGMTGTAETSSEEFFKVYGLKVIVIPTNKPSQRNDKSDLIFKTESGKFKAIADEVSERYKKGQPVLIGTVSIEKNEFLSQYLKSQGIPHEMLNAKNHSREGEIIAQAGKVGAVTLATNMAGRGVDIKLGGNPSSLDDYKKVKELGGLMVIGTERHDARRIDNQLRGRSGRQGDSGETQFFVSLDDKLIRIFGGDRVKNIMGKLGMSDNIPIENGMITKMLENAQEKIEGVNFDARKHVLEFDDVLNFQRKTMYERRHRILTGTESDVVDYLKSIVTGDPDEQNLTKIVQSTDPNMSKNFRQIILQTIDIFWTEHLDVMDYMRGSVNLRAYGQRDPLVEYKKEGLKLFKEMEESISAEICKLLPQIKSQELFFKGSEKLVEIQEGAEELNSEKVSTQSSAKTPDGKTIGRNDPCWCGSGKKYKKCHGK